VGLFEAITWFLESQL